MSIWDNFLSFGGKLSTIIAALFGVLFAIINHLKNKRKCSARDRLEKVVSPLFELLEPYMRNSDLLVPDEVKIAVDILIKNGEYLTGGRLREARAIYNQTKTQRSFHNLCRAVNYEYDQLCKCVDIPLRSFQYRKLHAPPLTFKDIIQIILDRVLPFLTVILICFAVFQIVVIASNPAPNDQSFEGFLGNDIFVIIIASILAIVGTITLIRGIMRSKS